MAQISIVEDNLMSIAQKILANEDLCKLLKYSDGDPLSGDDFNTYELLHKNVLVVPKMPDYTQGSVVAILFDDGMLNQNVSFDDITYRINVLVPWKDWILDNGRIRPFYISDELEKTLDRLKLKGMGTLYLSNVSRLQGTDDYGAYSLEFTTIE